MRIVIDLQGAQSTGSRNRGIGRYSTSLCAALLRNRGEHEIILAVSDLFPGTVDSIYRAFDNLLPRQNIRIWTAPAPVSALDTGNDWRRGAAQAIREAFLASLRPDFVVVTSLFEGAVDDAVTSVGTLANGPRTAVVLFDLIPLIHKSPYLDDPIVSQWYMEKIDHLRRADLCLAISHSSQEEGRQYLGLPDERCISISTDAEPHFQPMEIPEQKELALRARHGLDRPFLMYTGGIDFRKNIEGLILAYARLPSSVRDVHQLAIICSVRDEEKARLEALALDAGLTRGEVVMTGFVSDDDLLALYNLCSAFVFPSWHEGFGLPVLEAMRCGAPVIGAGRSSIPEVIGLDEALFDPHSQESMTAAILRVLTDDSFRQRLRAHGLVQAGRFSWDQSARTAIAAMERLHGAGPRGAQEMAAAGADERPRLAFVSPLPPARSGIADYSSELLRVLTRHYRIDVIVHQDEVTEPWIRDNCAVRPVEWLVAEARRYDRVLYQFGNSEFHQHMFELLEKVPGVVVLHDFFQSGVLSYMDSSGTAPNSLPRELYRAHGYGALCRRLVLNDHEMVSHYPCNLTTIQNSIGVIVHSPSTERLAREWYGNITPAWAVVPHLRSAADRSDRKATRLDLGFDVSDIVVCSFGMLAPPKQNLRLIKAWNQSSLAMDPQCHLVFVGENGNSPYGSAIRAEIARNDAEFCGNIRVTGWADAHLYNRYLIAADIAVQLRTMSRGETSGAVLDCMKHGLPCIVNANGSMADLDPDAVWMLPDMFTDDELIEAIEQLRADPALRQKLGKAARDVIETSHDPVWCAAQYAEAIEHFYAAESIGWLSIPEAVAALPGHPGDDAQWRQLAEAIGETFPARPRQRQLLVDISAMIGSRGDASPTAEAVLRSWLVAETKGLRVEPVYAVEGGQYRYARHFTCEFIGHAEMGLADEVVEFAQGDVFFGLASHPRHLPAHAAFLQKLRRHGVRVIFAVRDGPTPRVGPCVGPRVDANGEDGSHDDGSTQWAFVVAHSDGAILESAAAAAALEDWIRENAPDRAGFRVTTFQTESAAVDAGTLPNDVRRIFDETFATGRF